MDHSTRRREGESTGSKFWNYLKTVCLKSTIAGIPQIVAAENIPKKLIRTLVFFSCLFGFSYQFLSFLFLYWKYPIIMDVQVTSPSEIDLPAFTICDHNGLSLPMFCMNNACFMKVDEANTCKQHPRYCKKGALIKNVRFPLKHEKTLHLACHVKTYKERFMPALEEKITKCEMLNAKNTPMTDCNVPILAPVISGFLPTSTDCRAYNVLWKKPGEKAEKISSSATINLILKINPLTYLPTIPDDYISKYVEFHNPYAMPNPFITGFNIFKGKSYKFFIKEKVLKLLPPPFETNCMDYMETWEKNGGTGATTQSECIEECKMKMEYEERGCISYYIRYPNDNNRCDSQCSNETCPEGMPVYPKLKEFSDVCSKKCRPPCLQKQYEVTSEEMQVSEEVFFGIPDWRTWKNYIYVRTSFDKHEITTYTYSPKFEFIETFSYLGGYIGMWLGISLVAVFDFMESVATVVKYQWKRLTKNGSGRRTQPAGGRREREVHHY